MATGLGSLPTRRSDDAPRFHSGQADELDDFLREFEALATVHSLTDEEKVHGAVRYADSEAKQLWKSSDGYNEDVTKCDWVLFKKDLTDVFYASARKANKFTMRSLEDLVRRARRERLTDEEDLETYHREFTPIARGLKKKGTISDNE
ncbi:hypothetical protein BDZ89DRAFT_994402, partial [Hymenopellis radicata]